LQDAFDSTPHLNLVQAEKRESKILQVLSQSGKVTERCWLLAPL